MSFDRWTVCLILIGALIGANVFLWDRVFRSDAVRELTVAFLDIGQGDAIYIETPRGNQMLIDGGPGNALGRALSDVMPYYDRSLDILLVSNPDKDHIEGFVDIMKTYKVGSIVEPGTSSDTGVYKALSNEIEKQNIPRTLAERGMRIVLDEGIEFTVLFPDRDASKLSTNTGSLIGKLVYGDTSFLFPGDAPDEVEEYLAELDGSFLQSDVLKAGHHGSRTSTSKEFLSAVLPKYAVISSGEGNTYGHPHEEVLKNVFESGSELLRTDTLGTVLLKSDGETVYRD